MKKKLYNSHYCGLINFSNLYEKIIISGWINNIRNLGRLFFIEVRDITGIIQCIFKNKINVKLKKEYIVNIIGFVNKNKIFVEIIVKKLFVINLVNLKIPFYSYQLNYIGYCDVLKFRYIYMRNLYVIIKVKIKNNILFLIRNLLNNNNFLEIDTPILSNTTPKGAKDFFVLSKYTQMYYSLPQSPQIYKQIIMISGINKYYQIAKCFRNEDLRSDRQPEFIQLDVEISLINNKYLLTIIEKIIKNINIKIMNIKIKYIKKITYQKSIYFYKSDKKIKNKLIKILNNDFLNIYFILIENNYFFFNNIYFYNFLKKIILNFNYLIKKKYTLISNINRNFLYYIFNKIKINENYNILLIKKRKTIFNNLIFNKNMYYAIWIKKFPMFKWSNKYKNWKTSHHLFTFPILKDFNNKINPINVFSKSYDLILNNIELGGGSVRISNYCIQKKIFNILNYNIKKKFLFFYKSLKSGCPPMSGIAIGLDRLLMILTNSDNIKQVIFFPKNQKFNCLLTNSPIYINNLKNYYI